MAAVCSRVRLANYLGIIVQASHRLFYFIFSRGASFA